MSEVQAGQQYSEETWRKVSIPLAAGIVFLPGIFIWFLLRKGHSTLARAIGFGWAAALVVLFVILPGVIRALPDAPAPPADTSAAVEGAEEAADEEESTANPEAKPPAPVASASPPKPPMTSEQHRGMHCLNNWDGSHWKMQAEIKRRLRDPDSFEHVETRITRIDEVGNHSIFMTFRARNGIGGMNVQQAIGVVDNKECELHTLQIL